MRERMRKLTAAILMLVMVSVIFTACGSNSSHKSDNATQESTSEYVSEDIKVAALKGPTAIGMVKLMSDNEDNKTANNYTFQIEAAGDAFTAQIQDVVKYADQTALKDKNGTTVNGTEIANNNVAAFTNRVRYGSITFTGNKTLNDKPSAEVFRYTVVEKSADGGIVEDGYKSGVIKNDANGAIQFPAISYTKAGIHYYDVREINDSADTTGIAYDNTVYTVVVVVEDDNSESGTGLTTNAVYYKDFDYKTKTGTKVENNSITFANNMSASVSLEGMKTLDGKKVSKAGEYSFDIVETNASGDALEGEAPQSVSNDNTGKFTFPAYTYTDEGTHYYKITENQNNPKSGIKYDTSSYLVTVTVAKTVEDGKVSLNMTDVQLVQPNGNDYQWKVEESEAGQYRVELNVLTNKIKFEKKN